MGKQQQGKESKEALAVVTVHLPGSRIIQESPLGISAEFPDKMHPDCGQHHSMGCDPGQNKSEGVS